MAVSQKATRDTLKGAGEHMQQEASQELVSRKRHYFMALLVFIVLVGEADLPILQFLQAVVRDSDAMRVACQTRGRGKYLAPEF
jgi:hypothetical protein